MSIRPLRHRRALRWALGILAPATLVVAGCTDREAPPAGTPAIEVPGAERVTLREGFETSLERWELPEGTWQLRPSGDRTVLAQTATDRTFPVALWQARRLADVDVSVRFRPVSGRVDASGGIVFRARDARNYYVVRANSLEDNFRLYTVVDGDRDQIAGVRIDPPRLGEWHTLRVVAVGDHIQAYLDERLLLDHRDRSFAEGWVGLWTKADAVTEFDDLAVHGRPAGELEGGQGSAAASASHPGAAGGSPEAPPAGGTPPQGHTWSFDDGDAGTLPAGFTATSGRWALAELDDAPSGRGVLAQEAENGRPVFNVVLAAETDHRDLDLSVRLRAVSGRIDQGGGLVWRARDGQNYYIARYNPLEDNFRLYKVVDGRRTQLASADIRLDHEAWHTVRVVMHGDRIQCYLDGARHLDVRDATFSDPGHIGLWTKADARTHFDDLTLRPIAGSLDAEAIGRIVGVRAATATAGVVRVTWPRTEVAVTVDGMPFPPPAGLTTWAALSPAPDGALLMGDTVVFEDEVSPAMDAAFAHDLEVTALHNHFFFDQPKVYFMHLGGTGEPERLARGVRAVWDAVGEVRRRRPQPASRFPGRVPAPGPLDAEAIGRIIGHPASMSGGVVKVTLGREARMHGVEVGASMGLTTWAAFTGSDARAAIDGDFAMTAVEVQPVLRALRRAGIHVVALHNHMIGEEPAYFFTHFWGTGPAADLAQGFRSALEAQGRAGGSQ